MATSRITIRSIDYHKFRGLVVDRTGSIDDRDRCDREMAALCDAVHRLNCRDERFDGIDDTTTSCGRTGFTEQGRSFGGGGRRELDDQARLGEICGWYKLILESRRVRSVDVRLRSGWWDGRSNDRNGLSAGRLRSSSLRETLVEKTLDWVQRHQSAWGRHTSPSEADIDRAIDNPGVYVFKHRERNCFQLVGSTGSNALQTGNHGVFTVCSDVLREAYDGTSPEPLSALLVTSLAHSWDFYFIPVAASDGATLLRVLENDTILKHDSLWPYGLNTHLRVQSFFELKQLRSSCRRQRWPPLRDHDPDDDVIMHQQPQLAQLRIQLNNESKCSDSVLDLLVIDNDVTNEATGRCQATKARRPNRIVSSPRESTSPLGVFVGSSSRSRRHGNGRDASDDVEGANSSDSDGSSLGSTITATTVRTAINKSILLKDFLDELPNQTSVDADSRGADAGDARGRNAACSSSNSARSTSAMPAATTRSRCVGQGDNQRMASRARSASQTSGGQRTAVQRSRLQAERRTNGASHHVKN